MDYVETLHDAIQNITNNSFRFCKSFLQRHTIDGPQREGYEYFMEHLLPEIIQEKSREGQGGIWVKSARRKRRDQLYFSGVTVTKPQFESDDGNKYDIMQFLFFF